jgi:hypothetical protein
MLPSGEVASIRPPTPAWPASRHGRSWRADFRPPALHALLWDSLPRRHKQFTR